MISDAEKNVNFDKNLSSGCDIQNKIGYDDNEIVTDYKIEKMNTFKIKESTNDYALP